jgi:uncharacterized protein involved in exopolysaccharide biosynthesis
MQISAPPPQEVPLYSTIGRQALQDEISQTQSGISELLLEGDIPYRTIQSLPDLAMTGQELRQRIKIEVPKNTSLMHVSVKAPDPELSALLTNALVETGLEQYAMFAARSTTITRQFIEEQLDAAQKEYESAELELTQFQVINKIGDLSTAINEHYDLIGTLRIQMDQAEIQGRTDERQALEQLISRREAELQNLIGLSLEYHILVDRVNRARDTYSFMLDRRTEAQIKENQILDLGSVQVITPARPPLEPTPPLDPKIVALGTIVSLLVGFFAAFMLEYATLSSDPQPAREPDSSSWVERAQSAGALSDAGR